MSATNSPDSTATITDVAAVQLVGTAGQSLVRVDTDAGIAGYGEAGADGPTVRAQLAHLEDLLVGQDPLHIEKLYTKMVGQQHPYRPHVPTVSGVDIALWDLAGKLLDRPVADLLTGPVRDRVPLYVNEGPSDLLDPAGCRAWGESLRDESPYDTVKVTFDSAIETVAPNRGPTGQRQRTLRERELEQVRRAAEHVREGLGWDLDFIVHCHNEWDLPSAIGLAEAVAPAKPLWLEDPLPVEYADAWGTLARRSPVRILTGEKLERAREFTPFLENEAAHILQPDLAFAGGITGCRKIAALAEFNHVPITAHNVGSLVQNAATVHFGATIRNFWMTETRITQLDLIDEMGDAPGLTLADGALSIPDGPGLGVDLDEAVINEHRIEGEPSW